MSTNPNRDAPAAPISMYLTGIAFVLLIRRIAPPRRADEGALVPAFFADAKRR
jgi:hypothetical protein